ncbi:hypothetical protein DA075_35585 (plasmid) [Methylobacterium currus]|uniref:Uncharacterized protein n=2 Tax=Methylobacterium currus TaxID=2051553 RepID=A0A2R4WXG8_9HYPH|nr:hypothetical protein DA075_35585 [Methylobacterium currus]
MAAGYRLPRSVADRLETALRGRKNAAACLSLATWLGRFWSAPRRLLYSFPIDRRAIAGREDLGLSEARVRGAILTLEEIGFLARYEPDPGRRYQRTADGLHRRPLAFRFGEEYALAFTAANTRAQAARGAPAPSRRPVPRPAPAHVPVASIVTARPAPSPLLAQKHPSLERGLIMGEQNPASPLEAAIARLRQGIGL